MYQQPPHNAQYYPVNDGAPITTFNQHQYNAVQVQPIKPTATPPTSGYRDLPFAILFIINVLVIIGCMVIYGLPVLNNIDTGDATTREEPTAAITSTQMKTVLGVVAGCCVFAAALSMLMIKLIVRYAKQAITFSLWFGVLMSFAVAAIGFYSGTLVVGVIGLVFAALALCYAYLVRHRIPFATANLKVSAAAVSNHGSLYFVAMLVVVFQVVWVLLWALATLGISNEVNASSNDIVNPNGDPNGEICRIDSDCMSGHCNMPTRSRSNRNNRNQNSFEEPSMCAAPGIGLIGGVGFFFLLVSFYWGLTVVKNISHVTVAGTVGAWWFNTESSGATGSALKRSCTTSFGSICFGSLLVSIIKAMKTIVDQARRDNVGIAACLASCILGCLEQLLEIFNKWAFTYVGIYGFKFVTAGKSVFQLFKSRGFDAIINDDLISNVLTLVSMVIGLICAGAGVAFHYSFDATDFTAAPIILGIVCFFVGFGISSIPMSVIDSSVATVFVCFAEDPAVFANAHHELYVPLVEAWQTLYPAIMQTNGYYYN